MTSDDTMIIGRAEGLEGEPVWERPLPADAVETVAALLEAVRGDWRHRPQPVSGYRLDLEYDTATGSLHVGMAPMDPNERPPGGLTGPLGPPPGFAEGGFVQEPPGPFSVEAAAAAAAAANRFRTLAALGVDSDSAAYKAVAADGLPGHWSTTADTLALEAFEQRRPLLDALAEGLPLEQFLSPEVLAALKAAGAEPGNLRIVYALPATEKDSPA